MFKKLKWVWGVFASAGFLFGLMSCGGSNTSAPKVSPKDPVEAEWNSGVGLQRKNPVGVSVGLMSDYVASCQPANFGGSTLYVKATLTFRAMVQVERGFLVNRYVESSEYFADSLCTQFAVSAIDEGHYDLNDERNRLTVDSSRAELTPMNEKVAEYFSSQGLCGVTDWKKGKGVDLLSATSTCKPDKGQLIGIASLDENDKVIHTIDCQDPAHPSAATCTVIEYRSN